MLQVFNPLQQSHMEPPPVPGVLLHCLTCKRTYSVWLTCIENTFLIILCHVVIWCFRLQIQKRNSTNAVKCNFEFLNLIHVQAIPS